MIYRSVRRLQCLFCRKDISFVPRNSITEVYVQPVLPSRNDIKNEPT